MKKYFRFHARSFDDSMNTRVEVSGLSDIINIVTNKYDWIEGNIHIREDAFEEKRCLNYDEWGDTTYMVLADFDGYKNQCIGMCNFYEK